MKTSIKSFLIILILFISVAGVILPKELNNLDEIWNYNFARCIADGLLPYKDFNMVQTPLLPIICGIILKLTFNELIVMRILAVFLITTILFFIYKIFKRLRLNKYIINIYVIGIYLLFYKDFCIDYNYTVLLIILITIYAELKKEILEVNFKRDFLLGLLVGTSILFKQTTGLALIVIFVLYKLLLVNNKNEFKSVIKIIVERALGALIPILIFCIYLSCNNLWKYFLDYTVYSLNTFSNVISYKNLINGNDGIVIQIISIALPIAVLIMYYISILKKHTNTEQKHIFILFCYSIASAVVIFPISDKIHFLIGVMPSLIAICYMIYIFMNMMLEKTKKCNQAKFEIKHFMKALGVLCIIIIFCFSSFRLIKYLKNANRYIELKHFKYIPIESKNIKKIDNYILEQNKYGNKVYILDANAAVYMIPLDKYNKDYDLFLKGNIGAKSEEGQIEKLRKEENNTIILILSDCYKKNWQTPENVIKYVKENMTKIGNIVFFDIYKISK